MTIDEILKRLNEKGGPTPISKAEELVRTRVLSQHMAIKAIEAAEEKWPGFKAAVERLIDKELELERVADS